MNILWSYFNHLKLLVNCKAEVIYLCGPSNLDVEAGRSNFGSQSWLHGTFEANVGYRRSCVKHTYTSTHTCTNTQ